MQYESDLQTATVNVRTAKIQLLQLMNEQTTTVEAFDVTGPYDFAEPARPLADLRQLALSARPDLLAARQSIDKAKVDYRLAEANGTTDPDIGATLLWQPPFDGNGHENFAIGLGVSIPLRIFDRNQGEKQRTKIDITRNERLSDATRAQVFGDVDSAYATLMSTVALLQPYKATYLAQSTRVRDTVQFSFQRGGASLLDFLQAQQDYRTVQVSYVNLIAAFLNAVSSAQSRHRPGGDSMTPHDFTFITQRRVVLLGRLFSPLAARPAARRQEEIGAPPRAVVVQEEAGGIGHGGPSGTVSAGRAEQYEARPALSVTGVVATDVSRAVPVVSLASGRVVDLRVRLGDTVEQGQLLMRIQSTDISSAFSDYRHAVDRRGARAGAARSRQGAVRARRDRARRTSRSRRTPRTRRWSTSRRPPSTCACSASDPDSRASISIIDVAGAGLRRHHRAERHQRRRRQVARRLAQPVHDLRPVACLGGVRCLRERPAERARRRQRRDPSQRLSRSQADRAGQQHPARSSTRACAPRRSGSRCRIPDSCGSACS